MGLFARTKSIALVSLLVALACAAALGFLLDRIFRINKVTAELSVSIEKENQRDGQLRALQSLLAELETEQTAIDGKFVSPEGVVPFIELLEDAGRDAGVVVEIASVGIQPDTAANRPYEWLRVALRAEGSWAKLFHYIVLLETIPQAVKLDQVGLTQGVAQKGSPVWEGTFVIRAAKLKGPQP